MNVPRILLAGIGGFLAYFALGSIAFTRPALRNEFLKYPAVYRSQESMKSVMPAGMAAMLVAMVLTLAQAAAYFVEARDRYCDRPALPAPRASLMPKAPR